MKPTTRAQKECLRLTARLTPLTAAERKWATKNVPYFAGFESYGKVKCMHCGTTFDYKGDETQRCPHCKRTLHVERSRKQSYDNIECFVLLDCVEQWQVMRYFHVITQTNKGCTKSTTRISEIMQRWLNSKGQYVILAKQRNVCFYNIRWVYDSEMVVHAVQPTHYINRIDEESFADMIVRKLHPALEHCKYERDMQLSVFHFIRAILTTPYAETLCKSGHKELFAYCAKHELFSNKHVMAAVRIALKNKYDIEKDITLWFDYLTYLTRFNKDLHNAAYVCPKDLHAAHDEYMHRYSRIMEQKRKREEQQRLIEKALQAQKDNEQYVKRMKRFMGLLITDGNIELHVLRDIAEFAEEAKAMGHCVLQNEYYSASRHPYSLILSAQVDGKRTETVEVSLDNFTIAQSRGHKNLPTKYHDKIVSLVNSNMQQIRKAAGVV